jgi:hypothetical protein
MDNLGTGNVDWLDTSVLQGKYIWKSQGLADHLPFVEVGPM